MKLLLTSAGITNKSIENAFRELVGKPFNEILVAFIPTASNPVEGDKWWVTKDLEKLHELGCGFETIDIASVSKVEWLLKLEKVDVIFVEGGDTFYLMDSIHKSEGYEDFKKLLGTKVYIGVSAGSAICAKNLALAASQEVYNEAQGRKEDVMGFNIIPYYIFPHYGNKEWFPKVTKENIEKYALMYDSELYLIDDQSAILIDGQSMKVISEGIWEKIG